MLAVTFYDAVVALHVGAILVAFGPPFAYAVIVPFVERNHPQALPALLHGMSHAGLRLIAPAGGVALLLGAYLATDRDLWGEPWVTTPLIILVVLLGMGGRFFSPTEAKWGEVAQRDLQAAGGQPTWSAEYHEVRRRYQTGALISYALIMLAVYFMVAKPFA